jgi:hypothetical protein
MRDKFHHRVFFGDNPQGNRDLRSSLWDVPFEIPEEQAPETLSVLMDPESEIQ